MEAKIPIKLIRDFQAYAKAVYNANKTEARGLVYINVENNKDYLIETSTTNTAISATMDVNLAIEREGKTYYLCADIHSHHVMGAYFSEQDNADDKIRNIVYGVYSWKDHFLQWKFRYWNGTEHISLSFEEATV